MAYIVKYNYEKARIVYINKQEYEADKPCSRITNVSFETSLYTDHYSSKLVARYNRRINNLQCSNMNTAPLKDFQNHLVEDTKVFCYSSDPVIKHYRCRIPSTSERSFSNLYPESSIQIYNGYER